MESVYNTCVAIVNNQSTESGRVEAIFTEMANDYREMFQELERRGVTDVRAVLTHLFADGVVNWGRVLVALYWARQHNTDSSVAAMVADRLAPWIYANGGLQVFEPVKSPGVFATLYNWFMG